jgi:3-dehydroquinate synthase
MIIEHINISGGVSYKVYIGDDIFSQIAELTDLKKFSKCFFVVDKKVSDTFIKNLKDRFAINDSVLYLDISEKTKSVATLELIWSAFLKAGLDRKSLVFNIGGGCLGDISGFACATYMRGINFVQVPTTLLAQVDASVGGKVAVNFSGIKNLLGAFQQPHCVINDVSLLETLSKREFSSGLAEMVKHGFIYSTQHLQRISDFLDNSLDKAKLSEVIAESVAIKGNIVSEDVNEKGARKLLNFGHTVGHALESFTNSAEQIELKQRLTHGEAVALGMLVELRIAVNKNLISEDAVKILRSLLIKCSLPTSLPIEVLNLNCLTPYLINDKKNYKGTIMVALPNSVGSGVWDIDVNISEIETALSEIK